MEEEKKIYAVLQDGECQGIYLNLTEKEYNLIYKIFSMTGIHTIDLIEIEIREF
jgi:hypothetical protein